HVGVVQVESCVTGADDTVVGDHCPAGEEQDDACTAGEHGPGWFAVTHNSVPGDDGGAGFGCIVWGGSCAREDDASVCGPVIFLRVDEVPGDEDVDGAVYLVAAFVHPGHQGDACACVEDRVVDDLEV